MRLSINLEDDLYAAARSLAVEENCSISAAVNKLLRRSFEATPPPSGRGKRKFPTIKGSKPFRSEDVYKIEMED
jgi:hypothetical protein